MSSSYPGAVDSFTTKVDDVDDVMAADVNELQDGLEAVQAELGTDPAGTYATVKARLDDGNMATIHAATSKATPVDADELPLSDSAASNALKKLTWANLKATMYASLGALIAAGTSKATPVDADGLSLQDSAASNATKTLTWANLKAAIGQGIVMVPLFNVYDTSGSVWTSAARTAGTYVFDLQDANNNLPSGITGVLCFVQATWATVSDGSTQLRLRPRGGSSSVNLTLQGQANGIRSTGYFICPTDTTNYDVEIEVVGNTTLTNFKIAGYLK